MEELRYDKKKFKQKLKIKEKVYILIFKLTVLVINFQKLINFSMLRC